MKTKPDTETVLSIISCWERIQVLCEKLEWTIHRPSTPWFVVFNEDKKYVIQYADIWDLKDFLEAKEKQKNVYNSKQSSA